MVKKQSKPLTPEEIDIETQRVLKKMKDEGITLQQATGISDAFLEEMYSLAHAHYNRGNYKEALSLFQFLVGCVPTQHKFMLGLAATLHQLGDYREALRGFTLVLQIDQKNLLPVYYMADCFLRLGDEESALPLYELMIKAGTEDPALAELSQRSALIAEGLRTKHGAQ